MFENRNMVDMDNANIKNDVNEKNIMAEGDANFDNLYGDYYFEKVQDIPLTSEEINSLICKVLEGDVETRGFLRTAFLGTAVSVAKKVYKKGRYVPLNDLIGAANECLFEETTKEKLKKFDPSRPKDKEDGFKKYISKRIEYKLYDYVYEHLEITKSEREMLARIKKLRRKMKKDGVEWPTEFNDKVTLIVNELGYKAIKVMSLCAKFNGPARLDNDEDDDDNKKVNKNSYKYIANVVPSVERQVVSNIVLEEIYKELNEQEKLILDCVQQEEKYEWLMYERHNGAIAQAINSEYDNLTEEDQKQERVRISEAKKRIKDITVRKCRGENDQKAEQRFITDIIQNGNARNKFEEFLISCIGEYEREQLKQKVIGYLHDKNYIKDDSIKNIFVEGYFTSDAMPLRKEIIAIAFAENLSAEELNLLLLKSGCSGLYPRQISDLCLYFALKREYDLDEYINLCNKAQYIIYDNMADINIETTVGEIKNKLQEFDEKEKLLGIDVTTTERVLGSVSSILIENGTEEDLLEFIKNNVEKFTFIRERTYRVLLRLLVDYIEISCEEFPNRYTAHITMNEDLPIEERGIRFSGLLMQMAEFCNANINDINKINVRNILTNIAKAFSARHGRDSFPFDISRDSFLSMATFFLQHQEYYGDRKNGFINNMNNELKLAGFDKLDEDLVRDKSIIQVAVHGNLHIEDNLPEYAVFWDGICSITESHRRSKYSFL